MINPSREEIERLRDEYPKGCIVELIEMNDPYHLVPSGTRGEVIDVDDMGTIHVRWSTGSSLGVAYSEDRCVRIRTCPICHKGYKERPALLRTDSTTEICPECGTREALQFIGKTTKEINEIVDLIKKTKMDREALIEKIIALTEYKREELEKMSDSDLFNVYLYLEDMGLVASFDD